jgi:hypothetical protein
MTGISSDANATEIAASLSMELLDLLRYCPAVLPLFHSPKNFRKENIMTLEALIRGSGELGAVLATGWGIKLIDKVTTTIHVENLKPRDFEPCGPFQLIGRPYINEKGDFALLKKPDECGPLGEEQPNDYNKEKQNEKNDRITILIGWLAQDLNLTSSEIVAKFKSIGIDIDDSTARRYRAQARKRAL